MQLGMNRCTLCPRQCGADRSAGATGFCGATAAPEVASVCLHRGEEPPLNPIVNVFFSHCNLQCIYCQNWQISQGERSKVKGEKYTFDTLANHIVSQLSTLNSHLLGFVTASHYADQLPAIIEAVRSQLSATHEPQPTIVYNCGGYESVDTLRSLEGLVDIYLPDFKYMDPALAAAYSHAPDYPAVAQAALKEMRRQVGGGLKTDDEGHAYRGLIVRHLVLPGAVDNSIQCLEWLADEFPFGLHLSLMAQYFPPRPGLPTPLDRCVTAEEYAAVVDRAQELGLTDGWIQELDAQSNYRPDFSFTDNPFEP